MKSVKVNRYIAECGRGFWKKNLCLKHEDNCKCWKNPKYRTCLTCKWSKTIRDSAGESPYEETWQYRECQNPAFDESKFTPVHEKAPDVCINCPIWETNKPHAPEITNRPTSG